MGSDEEKAREFVRTLGRKRSTVRLDELCQHIGTREWSRVHAAIAPLVAEGILSPLKTARGNGSTTFPLFERYRIAGEAVPTHDLTRLHPALVTSSYLERHPRECHKWWDQLTALSDWLAEGAHERDVTQRERCWEVFGNEKTLESKGFAGFIRHACGTELRDLLEVCADTPEDLPYVVAPGVTRPHDVVVSENRDPYLAMRRCLLAGRHSIFGVPVDAVVYGCGNAVRQAGGSSLALALESMHAAGDARVRYWGDIDREGLTILAALCETGQVEPLVVAYEAMLSAPRNTPRPSPDGRDLPMPGLEGIFPDTLRERVEAIAAAGLLLPQESLSSHAIGEAMR